MELAFHAAKNVNQFFRKLHASGLWLTAEEHAELRALNESFCIAYASLASRHASRGQLAFKLRPKLHMFQEAARQNAGLLWAVNCLNASCWTDEDFIGKCSRISRTCYGLGLCQSIRTIQKVLGRYRVQFNRLDL